MPTNPRPTKTEASTSPRLSDSTDNQTDQRGVNSFPTREENAKRLQQETEQAEADKRLTIAAVTAELRAIGVTIRHHDGEYRVNLGAAMVAEDRRRFLASLTPSAVTV